LYRHADWLDPSAPSCAFHRQNVRHQQRASASRSMSAFGSILRIPQYFCLPRMMDAFPEGERCERTRQANSWLRALSANDKQSGVYVVLGAKFPKQTSRSRPPSPSHLPSLGRTRYRAPILRTCCGRVARGLDAGMLGWSRCLVSLELVASQSTK